MLKRKHLHTGICDFRVFFYLGLDLALQESTTVTANNSNIAFKSNKTKFARENREPRPSKLYLGFL